MAHFYLKEFFLLENRALTSWRRNIVASHTAHDDLFPHENSTFILVRPLSVSLIIRKPHNMPSTRSGTLQSNFHALITRDLTLVCVRRAKSAVQNVEQPSYQNQITHNIFFPLSSHMLFFCCFWNGQHTKHTTHYSLA